MSEVDFFGHRVALSDEPVSFDAPAEEKPKYRDLSQEGDYYTVDAVTPSYQPSQQPSQQPYSPVPNRINKVLRQAAWGLGSMAAVWFACQLAIASRSGGMDNIRLYHLGNANRAVPVLAMLAGGGAWVISNRR